MNRKPYSESDVERLLAGAARTDRRPMDDAMTERFLLLIHEEAEDCARKQAYHRITRAAAAVLVLGVGVSLLYLYGAQEGQPLVKAPAPECAPMESPASLMGGTPVAAAGMASPKRAYLNHLGNTLDAGYAPAPQKTYASPSGHRYGAEACGKYEITACTDTL